MDGKILIITGATSGIGKKAALELSKMGARVVITARNLEKGNFVASDISRQSGNEVKVFHCDLTSQASIRKFADDFGRQFDTLDVLINNAGVWHRQLTLTPDGFEETFAVNVLARYLMTTLLLPHLKRSGMPRVITTSSGLHFGNINFKDIEYRQKFSGFHAYRQSKLSVILLTRYLANILKKHNINVNCFHPGFIATDLGRNSSKVMEYMFKFFGQSVDKGAKTMIYLASDAFNNKISGEYLVNNKVRRTTRQSYDMAAAKRLMDVIENMTGERLVVLNDSKCILKA